VPISGISKFCRGTFFLNSTSLETTPQSIVTALQASHGITLLQSVLTDTAGQAVLELLHVLAAPHSHAEEAAISYSNAFRELALSADREGLSVLPDAWQDYLLTHLIDDVNLWSTRVEHTNGITQALHAQVQRDLRALHLLFQLDAQTLWQLTGNLVTQELPALQDAWVPWYDLVPLVEEQHNRDRYALAHQAVESADWATLIEPLEAYWSHHGTGPLARYQVLRWQGISEGLQGITHPDLIQLSNLIGYEREQALLKSNTGRFLANLPYHDILLYGAPGTGKSSTVKALTNAYAERGLRLVEVRKEYISDLPRIVAQLRERSPHFVLFIDDLSFEEHETDYKVLKMLLEGTAEARPKNILICATTNRLNLVRENFSDRGKPTEDVNWRDTMDEKQSLVHRFGMRVTFSSPDQQRYLKIVLGLAQQRGITLAEERLSERALRWERQHSGRSGRVARQFIDDLEAELKRDNL
jgi:predicted AAA+ superfamily ATPase